MSSLALMRWLESAPSRYDAGMRAITLGRVDALHDAVASAAVPVPGMPVLEIGCGTGSVTKRMAERGARVTAIEHNPEMLERARARIVSANVDWLERTASEIDALPPAAFDAVVVSLCMSEMSTEERAFVLREARRRLSSSGRLVFADEVRPRTRGRALVVGVLRAPQAAIGWLVAGSLSRPLRDPDGEIRDAGFAITERREWLAGSLAMIVARPCCDPGGATGAAKGSA
jgi:ubiquinone/menaquinone biosynthesis C-methylase UbiE